MKRAGSGYKEYSRGSPGPRRTLDEAQLREELRDLIARPFRSARVAHRVREVRLKLSAIDRRSPYK